MRFATDRLVWAKMNAGQHIQRADNHASISKTYLHRYTLGNTRLLSPMVFLTIALFQSAQSTLIRESFSKDNVNENGRKAIGLGYVHTIPDSIPCQHENHTG